MRHLYIIALFVCLVTSLGFQKAHGQVSNEIVESILRGDANKLATYMQSPVYLSIAGEGVQGEYSATQARFVLRDWFAKFPCNSYQIINDGSSEGFMYYRGDYRGAQGSFWVTFFMKGNKIHKLIVQPK